MSELRVGMLVKIVGCTNSMMMHHIGHIGMIISACSIHHDAWDIEGASTTSNGRKCSWGKEHLQPINPDNQTWGSFSDMMKVLKDGRPVEA